VRVCVCVCVNFSRTRSAIFSADQVAESCPTPASVTPRALFQSVARGTALLEPQTY